MTRDEFFAILHYKLRQFPQREVVRAMEYYVEYFNEASELGKSDGEIIASLGDADTIAQQLYDELSQLGGRAYTGQSGFDSGERYQNTGDQSAGYRGNAGNGGGNVWDTLRNSYYETKRKLGPNFIWVAIILLVITSPIWGGLIGGLFGLLMGVFGVIIGFGGAALGVFVGGIATLVASIWHFISLRPIEGVLTLGTALVLMGVSVLFFLLTRAIFRGVKYAVRQIKSWISGEKTRRVNHENVY